MTTAPLPTDLAAAHAMILAECAARQAAEADAAIAKAEKRAVDIEIERLRLEIARLKRARFGQSSEHGKKLLDQLELQLEELEATAAEESAEAPAAEPEADMPPEKQEGSGVTARRKPARRPLPAHLPRARVVEPAPAACPCCGGRLHKLGEDVTERWSACRRAGS